MPQPRRNKEANLTQNEKLLIICIPVFSLLQPNISQNVPKAIIGCACALGSDDFIL